MHAVVLRLDQLLRGKRRSCSFRLRAERAEHGARTPCADAEPRARLPHRQHQLAATRLDVAPQQGQGGPFAAGLGLVDRGAVDAQASR